MVGTSAWGSRHPEDGDAALRKCVATRVCKHAIGVPISLTDPPPPSHAGASCPPARLPSPKTRKKGLPDERRRRGRPEISRGCCREAPQGFPRPTKSNGIIIISSNRRRRTRRFCSRRGCSRREGSRAGVPRDGTGPNTVLQTGRRRSKRRILADSERAGTGDGIEPRTLRGRSRAVRRWW